MTHNSRHPGLDPGSRKGGLRNCARDGCHREAVGAIQIQLRAPAIYQDAPPIPLQLDCPSCKECFADLDPFGVLSREQLETFADAIARSGKPRPDVDRTSIHLVGFDDENYLALKRRQARE